MQKQNSKKKFLEKLYISLSFYFGDDDCDSLIKDYEEWFENEEMAEKSEHEICSGLGKPFDIARNLYKDSKEGKEHIIDLSLDKLSEQLNPDIFFRTNRQTLVSVHAIQKIENYFLGKIIVQVKPPFKDKITVSREKIAAMKLWLNY